MNRHPRHEASAASALRDHEAQLAFEQAVQARLYRNAQIVNCACALWLRRRGLDDDARFVRIHPAANATPIPELPTPLPDLRSPIPASPIDPPHP